MKLKTKTKGKTAAERQADVRRRRKVEGFKTKTVVVHESDEADFDEFISRLKKPGGIRGIDLTR